MICMVLFWYIGSLMSINISMVCYRLMLNISAFIINVSWFMNTVVSFIVASQMMMDRGMGDESLMVSFFEATWVMVTMLMPLS